MSLHNCQPNNNKTNNDDTSDNNNNNASCCSKIAAKSQCKKGDNGRHYDEHRKRSYPTCPGCHHEDYHTEVDKDSYDHDDFKLTLYYFNTRGRAELIRFILAYARQPFDDVRFTAEQWLQVKHTFPARQVPVLTVEHCGGQKITISQSLTIARYLATSFDLTGNNLVERAQCDEVVDCLNDLINLAVLAFLEQDYHRREIIKTKLREEEYPRIISYLERKLVENGGKHIVGDRLTYADLAIAWFLGGLHYRGADIERIQQATPKICELWQTVETIPQIKEWIEHRPAKEM